MKGSKGERYLTTVLMTDIVGSTEHAAELGDSDWREVVGQHHRIVRTALQRHRGREIDTAGDGFFATFDAPAEAIACALDVVEEVAALGIEIRAGIHTGEVEQSGKKVAGITVPIAARIMSLAQPSQVLVSATVRDLATGASLSFEDGGRHQLKGVPGEWQVFAVEPASPAPVEAGSPADAGVRRAAAVRQARSRPVWQRRPRMVAAILASLALVVVASGLLVWQPWLPPALGAIGDDSVGVIDATRGAIVSSIKVNARPGGIALGEGAAWVTNTGSDSVSRIDLATRHETKTIDVGRAPVGIAIANGSVWVANSGDRTVTRINAATARDVAEIVVGNGPTGVAASGDAVWVANFSDSTVVRLDATSGKTDDPIPVAAGPLAIAVDDHGVWVVSADAAAVTHIDPATGVTLAAPIALSSRPTAISAGAGAIWVASADGSVTRIDPAADRVTTTIDVGGSLSGIAATEDGIWVADRQGYVYKLAPTNPSSAGGRFRTTSSPEALFITGADVWIAARSSPSNHRGGTLRIAYIYPPGVDPLDFPVNSVVPLVFDGLVGYRRVGGAAGNVLLPNLAVSVPKPTDAGRTYTFQLRPGLRYSNGTPVNPADFRRGIERSFQIDPVSSSVAFGAIAGADNCVPVQSETVEPCNLSDAITVDDSAKTVSFRLARPDPDFIINLATPGALPVPEGVPMDTTDWNAAMVGTGPYMVASHDDAQTMLVRNPLFSVWSDEVRPDGYPDEIVWTTAEDSLDAVTMVERGDADVTPLRGDNRVSADEFDRLRSELTGQLHFASNTVTLITLNTTTPPFDNADVRRALSLAIDRAAVADLHAGPLAVSITCQVLPPGWPAYQPYCPYTAHPDPGGRWQAPDLDEARGLVSLSSTAGQTIVVGPTRERHASTRDYVVGVLRELGYDASADTNTDDDYVNESSVAVGVWEIGNTSVAASQFLTQYTCNGDPLKLTEFCDPTYDQLVEQALDLQATDAAAATAKWAEADHMLTDFAPVVPLYNEGSDFVSARVGNYQFNAAYQTLFDQLWVK